MWMFLCSYVFSIHLYKYQGAWLLCSKVWVHLVFQETVQLSSKATTPFWIPTSNKREFLLLPNLTSICGVSILHCGHTNRCVVASYFCFIFSSLMLYDIEHLYICFFFFCHMFIFFGEMSVHFFWLIKKK